MAAPIQMELKRRDFFVFFTLTLLQLTCYMQAVNCQKKSGKQQTQTDDVQVEESSGTVVTYTTSLKVVTGFLVVAVIIIVSGIALKIKKSRNEKPLPKKTTKTKTVKDVENGLEKRAKTGRVKQSEKPEKMLKYSEKNWKATREANLQIKTGKAKAMKKTREANLKMKAGKAKQGQTKKGATTWTADDVGTGTAKAKKHVTTGKTKKHGNKNMLQLGEQRRKT